MRLTAKQIWPQFQNVDQYKRVASFSISASGKMIAGSLPPSSNVVRLRSRAATSATRLPVATEPVNEIFFTSGCEVSFDPKSLPPLSTLSTPFGSTSLSSAPTCKVASGVYGEGLSTTVLPASNAGAIFVTAIITGKFHGVIAATTP